MDFTKLVKPLSEYYSTEDIKNAIKQMNEWYEGEAYDPESEDIIEDWENYEDCCGLNELTKALNYPELINNEDNQLEVLYTHCLYHLLPDQAIPAVPLMKHIQEIAAEDPLEQFHHQFQTKLLEKLHLNQEDAQNIADTLYNNIIKEQEYDIEGVQEDLEDEEESFIMEGIMDSFPQLSDRCDAIYNILSALTSTDITKINSDALLTLQMKSSQEDEDEAAMLCKKYLAGVFKDKNSQQVDERSFIIAKSWDISNQFPWLISMTDTYTRYKLESHKQTCDESKTNEPNASDRYLNLKPDKWFDEIDSSTKRLIAQNKQKANVFKHAIMGLLNRLSPVIKLNYKLSNTIWDSVNVFAKYTMGIQKFVHYVSTSAKLNCTPIQFDCMLIPRCVSVPQYTTDVLDLEDLYAEMPDFMNVTKPKKGKDKKVEYTYFGEGDAYESAENNMYADDEDEDDDDYDTLSSMQANQNAPGSKAIWNLEYNLKASGYKKDVDYFGPIEVAQVQKNGNDINVGNIMRILNEDLFMNVKKADDTRYKRYILVIDRRNPLNIKRRRMEYVENKRWNDRIYLICPKSNKGDEICSEYQYKMNEAFIENTRRFILPMSDGSDFGGLESGNGYRFLLSFHVHSREKVKCYWFFQAGSQRFAMHDIPWLWPRFFVKYEDKFQTLTKETKDELEKGQKEYPLTDTQFIQYRKGYKLVN